jgi:hypothetical protein
MNEFQFKNKIILQTKARAKKCFVLHPHDTIKNIKFIKLKKNKIWLISGNQPKTNECIKY